MYANIPLWLAALFIAGGVVALAWSADVFVDGSASFARKLGISPFIIGMLIIGFGTCAPEFIVSLMSGASGHANLSLGNAYGSCVFNVAGVLGVTAIVAPIAVAPTTALVGAPLMTAVAAMSALFVMDGSLSFRDSLILLAIFFILTPLYCIYDQKVSCGDKAEKGEKCGCDKCEIAERRKPVANMLLKIVVGLGVMVGASHILVWGSVVGARALGVSELVIGLTIVAIGTSLPELASSIAAARKGESELVMGNIVGSNLFNMLCVVGTAGAFAGGIRDFSHYVLTRDLPVLVAVSISVLIFGANWKNRKAPGVITRAEGWLWTLGFAAYTAVMVWEEVF